MQEDGMSMRIRRAIRSIAVAVLAAVLLPAAVLGQNPALIQGIEDVFDRPLELSKVSGPHTCILDTEHPDTVKDKISKKPIPEYKCRVLQRRIVGITGLPCVLVHHAEIARRDFERADLKAIVLMARSKSINSALDKELFALIRETNVPMIGFCGGLHLIVQAYGGKIEYMRKLNPGEVDPNPNYQPGWFKEWGFLPLRAIRGDPLFAGLPEPFIVKEMHAWAVVALPLEFAVLAETDECQVQVAKHWDRPLYGTQFHPEAYDEQHLDGRKLLANFFRVAGLEPPSPPAAR